MPFPRIFAKRYVASQNEELEIQHRDGRLEFVHGPKQEFFSRWRHESISVRPLQRHVATALEVMEVTFRDGRLERNTGPATLVFDHTLHEKIVVKAQQRHVADSRQYALVQGRDGNVEMLPGPCEVVFDPEVHERITVKSEVRHTAINGQYLIVRFQDGRTEHVQGPAEVCFNPFVHERITTNNAQKLAANEALIVYRRHVASPQATRGMPPVVAGKVLPFSSETANKAAAANGGKPPVRAHTAHAEGRAAPQQGAVAVDRRVVHGPAVFMPKSNEWLHEFSWHGSVKNGKGSKTGSPGDTKVPHALNFKVLRCMPDQIYYSPRGVRTSDDANLTVHLMIFYELKEMEKMLDNTNDLIGDILSAASADVMTFASNLTYEQFLQQTAELSKLTSFPLLQARLASIGTDLLKVVYRGYGTSSELQAMHDTAIARRTKLRLQSDAAREEQANASMELRCREERSAQQQALEAKTARHQIAMESMLKEQHRTEAATEHSETMRKEMERARNELEQQRALHDEEVRHAKELATIELDQLKKRIAAEQEKYDGLKKLGVDLTQVLCAEAATMPDKHVRIETSEGVTPQVHLGSAGMFDGVQTRR